MQIYLDNLWARTRLLRIGFIAGLIVGALAGWFFHGVISFIVSFFFVIILLLPFAIALIAWWRLRREVRRVRRDRAAADWSAAGGRAMEPTRRSWTDEPIESGDAITVESWESPSRRSGRSDPEA